MKVGYVRVSKHDQNLDLQMDALKEVGCEKVYQDKISGGEDNRPGLDELLSFIRTGDQIVVWKLDRLGRSMRHLVALVNDLKDKGIHIYVYQGGIDTKTSMGMMLFYFFGTYAEMERGFIQERTKAGLEAARARGRKGGRKKSLTEEKAKQIATLVKADLGKPVAYWCEEYGISKSTYYRQVQPFIKPPERD